jgi:glycosyltransferase involved in cell wall biosynthesis
LLHSTEALPSIVMQIALIIPALNEEPVIGQMLDSLPPGLFDVVIVADNGSTDRTGDVAVAHGARVVREEERGYGAACLKAMAALPQEVGVVVFMQADLSEDAEEARSLIQPILDGRADMVLGSRTMGVADSGALLPNQKFGNWLSTVLIQLLYGHTYSDLGPFRAIRRDTLERLDMRERNYGWTIEMQVKAVKQRIRVLEVPIRYHVRAAGENKVSGNLKASVIAGWRIITTVLRLR